MERCMSQIDDEKENGQLNGVVVVVVAAFIPDDAGARSMLATNYTSVFVTAQASAKAMMKKQDARGRHSPVYKLVQGGRDSAGPQPGHGMEPAQGRWFRRHPCQVCQAWAR
ncbi:hypothetical protein NHJ13734_003352 [Beauveria thailandica]